MILTLDEPETAEGAPEADAAGPVTAVVLPGAGLGDWRLSKGTKKRRSVPITGFTGLNGQGKTLSAVRDTVPSLLMGRPVLSTVALLDPHSGNPHPLYVPFSSWAQLHEWRNGDLLLDEITGIIDSRDGVNGMPKHIRRILPQMRRRNVLIRWTGIDWDNSDRRLRQITQAVAACRGYLPDRALTRSDGEQDAIAMWAPNRLFSVVTYDAQTLTQSADSKLMNQESDSGGNKRRRVKVLDREWYLGRRSGAFQWYNTNDSVSSVDASCHHVDPVTGAVCGGRIPEKVCKGHA